MDDRQLLLACRQTPSLFSELVARHINLVYSVACRHTKERQLAEDVTQEVFITLHRKLAGFDLQTPLVPWLFTTTRLQALQAVRAEARRHRHEKEVAMSHDASAAPDPTWSLIAGDIDSAVAELAPQERDAILLRYFAGKSHQEIASDLSITEDAARKRLQRAMESLRALLTRRGLVIPVTALAAALTTHSAAQAAPPALAATIAAATAHAPAAASTAISTLKGALMASAKLKIAAAIASLAVLVALPIAWVRISDSAPPAMPPPVAPAEALPVVAAPLDPADPYALKDGQIMKWVSAWPETRQAMFERAAANGPRQPLPAQLEDMLICWDGNVPKLWGTKPQYTLKDFALSLLHEFPQDVEGNAADTLMPGDYVFKRGATPDQYRQALASVIHNEPGDVFTLSYREVPRKVVVLRGTWNYHPLNPAATPQETPLIQFYDIRPNLEPGRGPLGSANGAKEFALWIGSWLGKSVLIEDARGLPDHIDWQGNGAEGNFAAHFNNPPNAESVLNHITEQTGLTWSEETRTVRRLFAQSLSPSGAEALADFNRIYGLKEGEFIRHVPPPFPASRWLAWQPDRNAPPSEDMLQNPNLNPGALIINWAPGTRPWPRMTGFGGDMDLSALLHSVLDVDLRHIKGDRALLDQMHIAGDIVMRSGATPDQLRAGMEDLLSSELGAKVTLTFRDVPREVYVFRGKWNYKPLDPLPDIHGGERNPNIPEIHAFASPIRDPWWVHTSDQGLTSLAIETSLRYHITVYIEAENLPPQIGYYVHTEDAATADPTILLDNIARQTGLTWTKETRTLHCLFVELGK